MAKTINIGIDIRDLKTATTGQKTYLEELCREFRLLNSECRFYFFDTSLPVYTGERKLLKLLEHVNLHIWKQVTLPIKAWLKKCKLVFCTDYFVPYLHLGFETATVFHDAFFFENPEHYNRIFFWFFKVVALPSAKRCRHIIVPTDYARQRIHQYTGIPLNKLVRIYEGPKTLPHTPLPAATTPTVLEQYGLKEGQYLLHVGIMNKRKNIPALILAFKQLKEAGYSYKLVLAGNPVAKKHINDTDKIYQTIEDQQLQKDVVFTGYLSNESLAVIYQHAFFYVFPSLNEGFGIPILEAFSYDLPVLVANNTCLPEVGGDAVLEFDPYDVNDIGAKMCQLIEDPALRNRMIVQGRERLQQFSWKKATQEITALFINELSGEKK
jgi:glycosyltransferase involved in cell wall biosynthesis